MNTLITSIAKTMPAPREAAHGRAHRDPAMVAVVGCGAGSLLALSAILATLHSAEATNLALGGNAALVLFALLGMNRPYRRFWMPALVALICTGLTGLALTLLPLLEIPVMQVAITRFGLDGVHILAQLAAMALTAMAWSTAGRSTRRMRASAVCVGLLAAMQMAQAMHGAIDTNAAALWAQAIDLVFALWLVRTAFCLLRPRFRA